MFLEHLGLVDMPFRLTPDDRYFFASQEHSRALSHLLFGLAQSEGFIVVTGEVGAGKTTLVERLTTQLNQGTYRVASITTAQVGPDDLLRLIAAAFGLPETGEKASVLLRLRDRWRNDRAQGRRALIIVDEAQGLTHGALEELRMLSNMADHGQALVQIVLLGQPQFREVMSSPDLDQLRQRVLASYHLGPLGEADTGAYVIHRFAAAGGQADGFFAPGALAAVYRFSGGIPRRINRLCSRILLDAALEKYETITPEIVDHIARELEGDLEGGAIRAGAHPAGTPQGQDQGDQVVSRLFQVINARSEPK